MSVTAFPIRSRHTAQDRRRRRRPGRCAHAGRGHADQRSRPRRTHGVELRRTAVAAAVRRRRLPAVADRIQRLLDVRWSERADATGPAPT